MGRVEGGMKALLPMFFFLYNIDKIILLKPPQFQADLKQF